MENRNSQLVTRKKTFWKMLKTIFLPAQSAMRLMTGCGGGKSSKLKRRLTLRNMQQAKDAFLQSTIQRPPPNIATEVPQPSGVQRTHSRSDPRSPTETIFTPTSSTWSAQFSYDEADISTIGPPMAFQSEEENAIRQHADVTSSSTVSALPAPLNLEEAQQLLDSLAIISEDHSAGHQPNENAEESTVERIINVEIEQIPPEQRSQGYSMSPSSSFDTSEDGEVLYNENTNNNEIGTFNEGITRMDLTSLSRLDSILSQGSAQDDDENISTTLIKASSMRRSKTSASLSYSPHIGENAFHGWRRSSVEVSGSPPITLAYIPSGLMVGDRIVWVKDDHPEIGTVRWIGKIRGQFYAGVEFDKPVGNSSGLYGYGVGMYKRLFTCQLPYGKFIPVKELILYKDYHDTGAKSGIVCIICRDDFLDNWEPDPFAENNKKEDEQATNMVSTKCGHLYHWGCIDHWFSTKKRSEYHCPFCLRPMERDEIIRIFPSQI